MPGPVITIDLQKIEANTRAVVSLCRDHGIEVTGVTKVTCGMPQVARAMLRGGVTGIGESRLQNVKRLRDSGIQHPIMLLRIPPLSQVDEVVTSVNISLNSEFTVIKALSKAAEKRSVVHEIILMIDLGDLREGVWPADLIPLVEKVVELPGIRIVGLGTNLTCYGGVIPTPVNMGALVDHAHTLERLFNLKLRHISGGNSSSLPLLAAGKMPSEINHLRIGEAILLGRETIYRQPWPGTVQDAFLLTAELIELKKKPSLPIGELGEDAFGGKPTFVDRGFRVRGILNVGREDIHVEGITPVDPNISILGASSDHLLVDVTEAEQPLEVGDDLNFQMNYAALLASMTSEYVEKDPIFESEPMNNTSGICVIGGNHLLSIVEAADLVKKFATLGHAASKREIPPAESRTARTGGTADTFSAMASAVETAVAEKQIPLILGEDHRASLGGLSGLARCLDTFGLIWLDARASFMPPAASGVGPAAEAILSSALGYDPAFQSLKSRLSPENVVLIGLRDVNPSEAELITHSRVQVFTMEDVDAQGIREVMRQGLRTAAAGTQGFYVSFCPAVTEQPGTESGFGGLTYRETHQAMEMIARSGLMRAMDVVGLSADWQKLFALEITDFIMSCFGKKILGR